MSKLFEKLIEMERGAKPAPWLLGDIIDNRDGTDPYDFIAEARNAIPRMLQAIYILTEALENIERCEGYAAPIIAQSALKRVRELGEAK